MALVDSTVLVDCINGNQSYEVLELKSLDLSMDSGISNKISNQNLSLVVQSDLAEPESENSPRGDAPFLTRSTSVLSFASTVSELDYPQYAMSGNPLWSANGADVDDMTCPGAQAESYAMYQQAVYGQLACWNGQGLLGADGISALFSGNQPSTLTADALQDQAYELDRAAEQLMAAAMEAKTAASKLKEQQQDSSGTIVTASVEWQTSRWSSFGQKSKKKYFAEHERTTVMLRNLPNDYTREMVVALLDGHGFAGLFDFVYLPIDFKRRAGLGYAFVNFIAPLVAQHVFATMQGFAGWQLGSSKVLEVAWGEPLQGLEAHIDRYRNSPVMHGDVPDKYRPLLFSDGVNVPFPTPTKKIQKPRMKLCRGTE